METQEKFTKLLNTDIIAVEVPKDATDISLGSKGIALYFIQKAEIKHINLSFGKCEILGEATEDEISFDVEPYAKSIPSIFGSGHRDYYDYCFIKRDITKTAYRFTDKNESFRSLLQASGLNWVNEIKEPCLSCADNCDFDKCLEWQEAESKLIKGKLIFLKIIK